MKHPVEIEESYNLFLKEYPDVLTTKDLQHILSVSSKTVFKLLHSSQIKSIKVGRNFRIPKIYLLLYLGLVPDEAL
jgi:excisionase family DNA binding protein